MLAITLRSFRKCLPKFVRGSSRCLEIDIRTSLMTRPPRLCPIKIIGRFFSYEPYQFLSYYSQFFVFRSLQKRVRKNNDQRSPPNCQNKCDGKPRVSFPSIDACQRRTMIIHNAVMKLKRIKFTVSLALAVFSASNKFRENSRIDAVELLLNNLES